MDPSAPSQNTNSMNSHEDNLNNLGKNNEEENKKNHRRSKNEIDGRTYICKQCGKSYLSYPALYTHCKQKHNSLNSSGRGRGRPKKDNLETNPEKLQYNPNDSTYFLKEERTGKTQEYTTPIKNAFSTLYNEDPLIIERNKNKGIKHCKFIEDNIFLCKFLNDAHDINYNNENENEICDNVFIWYLNHVSWFVKSDYYQKIIVFVTLFRSLLIYITGKRITRTRNILQSEARRMFRI